MDDIRTAVVRAVSIMTGKSESLIDDNVPLPPDHRELWLRVGIALKEDKFPQIEHTNAQNIGQLLDELKAG